MGTHVSRRWALRLLVLAATGLAGILLAFAGSGSAAAQAGPTNDTKPSIDGSAREGQSLEAHHGDWTSSNGSDIDYDYQWLRCNSDGDSCSEIGGATDNHYALGSADVGTRLRVRVTATDSTGSSTETSTPTDVIAPAGTAPANTSPPSISGVAQDNNTLTATTGSWSGSTPLTYAFQWRRCDSSGNNCSDLATGQAYRVTSKDVGTRLRVLVTATNSGGSATAISVPTAVVLAAGTGPKNSTAPAISGTAQDGQTLTVNAGTWTGNTPITFTYQWQRCDANGNGCVLISGATAATYKASSTDVGHRLNVVVTAKNPYGTTPSTTAATAVVVTAGPAGAIKRPDGTTSIPVTSVSLPTRLVVDRISFSPTAIHARNERITARFRVIDSHGYVVRDALVYAVGVPANRVTAPGEVRTDQSGWATLSYSPLRGLPLKRGARVTFFVRARKPGENVLSGVSTRRLVSVGVHPFS
jgi:hypothetical protein